MEVCEWGAWNHEIGRPTILHAPNSAPAPAPPPAHLRVGHEQHDGHALGARLLVQAQQVLEERRGEEGRGGGADGQAVEDAGGMRGAGVCSNRNGAARLGQMRQSISPAHRLEVCHAIGGADRDLEHLVAANEGGQASQALLACGPRGGGGG